MYYLSTFRMIACCTYVIFASVMVYIWKYSIDYETKYEKLQLEGRSDWGCLWRIEERILTVHNMEIVKNEHND